MDRVLSLFAQAGKDNTRPRRSYRRVIHSSYTYSIQFSNSITTCFLCRPCRRFHHTGCVRRWIHAHTGPGRPGNVHAPRRYCTSHMPNGVSAARPRNRFRRGDSWARPGHIQTAGMTTATEENDTRQQIRPPQSLKSTSPSFSMSFMFSL